MSLPKANVKPLVLVVDDTPANLVAIEAVLGADCDLVSAHSGAEALAILDRSPNVDLILMDLQMPEMDGYETAARIQKIEGCEDIPIIFITAVYKEEPHIRRAYEVGGMD